MAFPKLVTFTNRIWVCWARLPWYGGRDMCGTVIGGHALSPFHAMALNLIMLTVRLFQGPPSVNECFDLIRLEPGPPPLCSNQASHRSSQPRISSMLDLLQQRGEASAFSYMEYSPYIDIGAQWSNLLRPIVHGTLGERPCEVGTFEED